MSHTQKGLVVTFRNPVGVITEGCTWLLQKPSHLFTFTSALQVRCKRPSSSNSSLIKCISDFMVSQFSWLRSLSRYMASTFASRCKTTIVIKTIKMEQLDRVFNIVAGIALNKETPSNLVLYPSIWLKIFYVLHSFTVIIILHDSENWQTLFCSGISISWKLNINTDCCSLFYTACVTLKKKLPAFNLLIEQCFTNLDQKKKIYYMFFKLTLLPGFIYLNYLNYFYLRLIFFE